MRMKFLIGIIIGSLLGGYLWTNVSPEQRETARNAVNRVEKSDVSQAVADGASDIAAAASERVAGKIDEGAQAVKETVEANGTSAD